MALVCPDNSSECRSSYCSQSRAPIRSWSRYEWPIRACDTLQPMMANITLATRMDMIKTCALCADECRPMCCSLTRGLQTFNR